MIAGAGVPPRASGPGAGGARPKQRPLIQGGASRSDGAMSHASGPNAVRVVVAAMLGNLAIATLKFVAAAISGSIAILAEAVHSVADTANQGLLLLGMRLARVQDPVRHPFGRAKEAYFWGFIVALVLFSLGGVFAIYEGVHKLLATEHGATSPIYAVAVLLLSIGFELSSFTVAWREFKKARGSRGLWAALFQGKVWGWSRHPNYFFECLFWLGIALIALSPSGVWAWGWAALGAPAFMVWLLTRVSGIPPLEAHMERSRGRAWRDYAARTSPFLPLPPRASAKEILR